MQREYCTKLLRRNRSDLLKTNDKYDKYTAVTDSPDNKQTEKSNETDKTNTEQNKTKTAETKLRCADSPVKRIPRTNQSILQESMPSVQSSDPSTPKITRSGRVVRKPKGLSDFVTDT